MGKISVRRSVAADIRCVFCGTVGKPKYVGEDLRSDIFILKVGGMRIALCSQHCGLLSRILSLREKLDRGHEVALETTVREVEAMKSTTAKQSK